MKTINLFIVLLVCKTSLFGQIKEMRVYNVDQLQGVWQMYANYTHPTERAFYQIFHIFKERKWLTLQMHLDVYHRLSIGVSEFGFANTSHSWFEITALDSLEYSGSVFVTTGEHEGPEGGQSATIFHVEERSYLNIFRDECIYIDKLPKDALIFLYKRGIHDNRDYIKEFLGLRVYGIRVDKSMIYETPETITEMYLIKDDIVIVIGEEGQFLKIEYETDNGDTVNGFIKKEDAIGIQTENN